jgi:hypothetical protein
MKRRASFQKDKWNWQSFGQSNQKKEKTHTIKIRDEKEDITTDIIEIQRIIMQYFENLYSNKLENPVRNR